VICTSRRIASCCWRACWTTNSPASIAPAKFIGGVFLGRGQEALSVSIGVNLREGDVFAPLIRDMAGRLAFNEPVVDAARTFLGSALGSDAWS
jgi:TPP-dependent pyruvate/acetoin dehydrogenase alpha subunit